MKRPFILVSLLACAMLWHPPEAAAQYTVQHSTLASGGGIRSGSNFTWDSAGQGAVSEVIAGGSYRIETGFWFVADLSSTVDVAIASFTGIYGDDAVTLAWSFSNGYRCDGIYVYRALDGNDEFEQLNMEPLPSSSTMYRDETAIPGRIYLYRIGAIENDREIYSIDISVSLPPKPLTLHQNYPNPFNPSTAISYFLPVDTHVSLSIYDIGGHLIRTLVDGHEPAGTNSIRWDGRNNRGSGVCSGVYYYRLIADRKALTRKLVLMR